MSALVKIPFSRLWRGRSRSGSNQYSADFVGDAAPPFTELASGSDPVPTSEELERIRYYHSKMTAKDSDYVVRVSRVLFAMISWFILVWPQNMDLTNGRRRLICAGRLFRTDSTFERKGMYELFVLLFDNYRMKPLIFLINGPPS